MRQRGGHQARQPKAPPLLATWLERASSIRPGSRVDLEVRLRAALDLGQRRNRVLLDAGDLVSEVCFPETSPRFPGVELYRGAFDNWDFTIKKAIANLRVGIDTWCHWHSYHSDPKHRQCEMYVQDWLTELPFCAFKQIAVIFPGVDLEKHAVGRRRLYVAGDSTIESSIEYAQRINAGCRPDFERADFERADFVDNAGMMHS